MHVLIAAASQMHAISQSWEQRANALNSYAAQDYANRSLARVSESCAREMTAADLGLPIKHWSDCAVYNSPAFPAGPCDCGGWTPDAPYSFWLGADA
jgi:hypothetical protein